MSSSSNSGLAKVEQDSLNKVPVLLQGDLTPSVMCQYENACLGFFEGKEIAPEKQVQKILTRLRDDRIQEWISIDRDEILSLMFAEFMVEFKASFLPEDWEEISAKLDNRRTSSASRFPVSTHTTWRVTRDLSTTSASRNILSAATCITRDVTWDLSTISISQTRLSASLSTISSTNIDQVPTEIPLPDSRSPSPLTPLNSPLLKTPSLPNTLPTPISPSSLHSSLGSPPPLVSISDSDSDNSDYYDYLSYNMSAPTTTLLKRNTTAIYSCDQGCPPVITPGKFTPDLLFDFENGAYSYFSFKDIKPEKEVSKVAGGLQDGRVQTWYRLNHVAVDAAGFPAFMKTIRESWLEPGWEQDVKLTILASHQGSMPIAD
ncbi:hypothetical protein PILCRDRAFT_11259 [Piloderma croceum F 1598]|uniref:Uncharacterized protein n=1 Tax=Piloderma croceum (strain F 1598) TaxID=765440 RepID=A0A0C3FEG2_PILCF|nr:hypothetical protein PILCRDRAFT_11259 [Piloderma croceum F 1598]